MSRTGFRAAGSAGKFPASSALIWVFASLLSFLCIVVLTRAAMIAGLHVPLDSNEGWNAYHSLAAISGGTLYPQSPSLLFNNYPPLSFYVVGTLGRAVGDNIIAGRILSLFACVSLAVSILGASRIMRVDVSASLFGAAWFIAGLTLFSDYVGMDDPQMFGQGVGMLGLTILLRWPASARAPVIAALFLALACFIKHNLVALPIALVFWLAIYDWRRAVWLAASGLVFVLLGAILFRAVYGVELLGQLASARTYDFGLMRASVGNWIAWCGGPCSVLVALVMFCRGDRYAVLCCLYAVIAILTGAGFSGGAGVDMNVWFDSAIALSLAAGITLTRFGKSLGITAAVLAVYVIPLLYGAFANFNSSWLESDFWLHPMRQETIAAKKDVEFLKAHNGAALCEMLSLCYWAGKPPEADVFNLGQAYGLRKRDDAVLAKLLEAHAFGAVQFDSLSDFALTDRVKRALLMSYRTDHANDNGVFLVPIRGRLMPGQD